MVLLPWESLSTEDSEESGIRLSSELRDAAIGKAPLQAAGSLGLPQHPGASQTHFLSKLPSLPTSLLNSCPLGEELW